MNPNRFKQLQLQLPSLNSILFFVLLAWVLGAIGLGGLIKSLLVVIVILAALPVVALLFTQWWVRKNLIQADCPSCGFELTGVKDMALQCPNCGEQLSVVDGQFIRQTQSGTIDVNVIDVDVVNVVDVVDVTALPSDRSEED
jgi:predicted RNA-binding Zn-ribbon protein involved in translation (DUF1610 family)